MTTILIDDLVVDSAASTIIALERDSVFSLSSCRKLRLRQVEKLN